MYYSTLYEPYLLVHSTAQVSLLVYDRRSCVSICTHVSTYVPMGVLVTGMSCHQAHCYLKDCRKQLPH